MLQIALANVPNQSLSFSADNNFFTILLQKTYGCMSATVTINDVLVVSGARVVAGFPILNYRYLEQGNFVILTANDELPDYTQFGITQNLFYASQVELDVLRAGA